MAVSDRDNGAVPSARGQLAPAAGSLIEHGCNVADVSFWQRNRTDQYS